MWKRTKEEHPREGQTVLGWDEDIRKAFVYVYRKGHWHYQNEEHFWGTNVIWWMSIPEPPSLLPRRERKRRRKAEIRKQAKYRTMEAMK